MSRLLDAPGRRPATPPTGHRHRRSAGPEGGRRGRSAAVPTTALLLVLALVTAACTVPWVRHELRASFTRLPSTYTELYFDGTPAVARGAVVVPVAVVAHGDAPRSYRLRIRLVTASGRTEVSRTVGLTTQRAGTPRRATVRLPYGRTHDGAVTAVVRVALQGRAQTLHYTLDIPGGSS
ncbi:hypothetical protein AB0N17_01900 [Streptomyces sp. NPDC051133]|uniref:hypothetical protein n=1 Tax=Streptomyces sp. NPDC051133 TaxID=3155521 RepID=UPI00344464B1